MEEKREIPFGRPWITDADREAVLRVLGGHILTHGPECKSFETEFAGFMGGGHGGAATAGTTGHAVTMSSCMAALHMAYTHLGLKAGDEVIVPSLTHVAAVHGVEWVGATPVFVEPDPSTGNLTAERIEPAITPRTKAISLVHFLGVPCEMDAILALAERRGLKIVEDCAIALGARWKGTHVGLFGDYGTFSFYPVKHITTAEGGMLTSRHRHVVDQIAKLRAFGVDRKHDERTIPGMYDAPQLGLNYRMSELQAALGRTQLQRIDENIATRKANFRHLANALSDIDGLTVVDPKHPDAEVSPYCLVAILDGKLVGKRNEAVLKLNALGVGTSVYYPQPVPRMHYYQAKYGYDAAKYPVATRFSDQGIAFPVGWHVSREDLDYIARAMKRVVSEVVR